MSRVTYIPVLAMKLYIEVLLKIANSIILLNTEN